jgi:hypothetical protein
MEGVNGGEVKKSEYERRIPSIREARGRSFMKRGRVG